LEKLNNTIRIAAIGDSFTFGMFVELEDTWPKILERELNKNKKNNSIKYEVMNFGVPGYNFEHYIENIKLKVLNYNPDIIIIGIVSDDFRTELREAMYKKTDLILKNLSQNLSEKEKTQLKLIILSELLSKYYKNFCKDKKAKDEYVEKVRQGFEILENLRIEDKQVFFS
jgi:hypothetical protein